MCWGVYFFTSIFYVVHLMCTLQKWILTCKSPPDVCKQNILSSFSSFFFSFRFVFFYFQCINSIHKHIYVLPSSFFSIFSLSHSQHFFLLSSIYNNFSIHCFLHFVHLFPYYFNQFIHCLYNILLGTLHIVLDICIAYYTINNRRYTFFRWRKLLKTLKAS